MGTLLNDLHLTIVAPSQAQPVGISSNWRFWGGVGRSVQASLIWVVGRHFDAIWLAVATRPSPTAHSATTEHCRRSYLCTCDREENRRDREDEACRGYEAHRTCRCVRVVVCMHVLVLVIVVCRSHRTCRCVCIRVVLVPYVQLLAVLQILLLLLLSLLLLLLLLLLQFLISDRRLVIL